MKILVTGGAGFVGSRLVPYLVGRGHDVGILGRSVQGGADGCRLTFYAADIASPIEGISEAYEAVIHLAAANDVDSRNAGSALVNTTLGTKHVLDLAVAMGSRRFIYFSTFQVYGLESGDVSEQTVPSPVNDYGLTHLFAEQYVGLYRRQKGLEAVCVRPTNIFGCPPDPAHDRWSLVPACFCMDAFNKGGIELLSSGKQHRDFISLDETAAFTEALCTASSPPEVINLASGESQTILEVAQRVQTAFVRIFGASCRLKISGEHPQKSIPLRVSTKEALRFLTLREDLAAAMDREIEDTLRMIAKRSKP